jgi:5-methyltetrahydropteroyltriglutamate--homocysteine methyltransferase
MRDRAQPGQRAFAGVTNPIPQKIKTAAEISDRICEAADYVPIDALGATDDCGFFPFDDDSSTTREIALAKIRARIEGVLLPNKRIGLFQPKPTGGRAKTVVGLIASESDA